MQFNQRAYTESRRLGLKFNRAVQFQSGADDGFNLIGAQSKDPDYLAGYDWGMSQAMSEV